ELLQAAVRVAGVADPDVATAARRADAAAGPRHDAAARADAAARVADDGPASPFARDALHRFGSCAAPQNGEGGEHRDQNTELLHRDLLRSRAGTPRQPARPRRFVRLLGEPNFGRHQAIRAANALVFECP